MSEAEIIELIEGVGKYRIIDAIAEGNAIAFKAHHVPLQRDVFLKVCERPETENIIFEEPQLLVEVTANEQRNPQIIEVFDAERLTDDLALFCMEWADKGSLLKVVEKREATVGSSIEIVKCILRGLSAFHRNRMVHRDIKPANILLSTCGDHCIAKLGDFGSATRLEEGNNNAPAVFVTKLYLPLEGVTGDKVHSVQSDVYQAGVILAELLCGALPYAESSYLDQQARKEIKEFGGKTLQDIDSYDASKLVDRAIARKVQKNKLIDLLNWPPFVSRSLKSVVLKATNSDISKRYGTAADMLSELDAISCPDWNTQDSDTYLKALAWKDRDWKIVERPKGGYEVKRSKLGVDKWRRVGRTHLTIQSAISAIVKA